MDEFIRLHTTVTPVPFVPELRMHTATDVVHLWERTEAAAGAEQPPPFWAFPWAGGQALARYLLDHPDLVRHKRVLDLASGSGLVAVAAARAGASEVVANEIDPRADVAIAANAAANHVTVQRRLGDVLDSQPDFNVVVAGDVFYSRDMATRMLTFLQRARRSGAEVLVGDPGRAYVPKDALDLVTGYEIPVVRDLEDANIKHVKVWRVR